MHGLGVNKTRVRQLWAHRQIDEAGWTRRRKGKQTQRLTDTYGDSHKVTQHKDRHTRAFRHTKRTHTDRQTDARTYILTTDTLRTHRQQTAIHTNIMQADRHIHILIFTNTHTNITLPQHTLFTLHPCLEVSPFRLLIRIIRRNAQNNILY